MGRRREPLEDVARQIGDAAHVIAGEIVSDAARVLEAAVAALGGPHVVVNPGIGAYAAAKGGIVLLTKALAVEYGPDGIRANAVMPAVVDTALAYTDRPDFDSPHRGRAG